MTLALRTPRLLLREWRDADREPFAAMSADPEVMAIRNPGEAPLIGAVGLHIVPLRHHSRPR
jgi:RimJ/RimL family protein N-acetyltransferase